MEQESFVTIFERQYRPQLVMAFAIPLSQQLTGINIVAFYAPNLFQSVGFGNDSALLSAIILGLVNLGSILVSAAIVDRFGRRFLFIAGGIQMLVCMVTKLSFYKQNVLFSFKYDISVTNSLIMCIIDQVNSYTIHHYHASVLHWMHESPQS